MPVHIQSAKMIADTNSPLRLPGYLIILSHNRSRKNDKTVKCPSTFSSKMIADLTVPFAFQAISIILTNAHTRSANEDDCQQTIPFAFQAISLYYHTIEAGRIIR